MSIDFNVDPYYDDFDEDKKFHRILFKPGVAVQARELTQLQTILQNQIERFGRHVFKEGSMVIPGQASVDTKAYYVKIGSVSNTNINSLPGTLIYGSSGVVAKVIAVAPAVAADPNTLIVKYINADDATKATLEFGANENIFSNSAKTIQIATVQAAATVPTGFASVAQIEEGVYFISGNFVKVDAQTIILEKYNNTPTYRVGLLVDEQLITSIDDISLSDNAIGSYNYAAPGADRYKINTTFAKLEVDSLLDQEFVELLRVENGVVLSQVTRTEYSVLETTLARRTYDESGDYTVRAFQIQPREFRNNNRGTWSGSSIVYLNGDIVTFSGNNYVSIQTHTSSAGVLPNTATTTWVLDNTPTYNRGVNTVTANDGSPTWAANLSIGLDPGKAYVRGYEIEKIATEFITIPKARSFSSENNDIIQAQVGNHILVTNLANGFDTDSFGVVNLFNQFTATRGTAAGTQVGTARVRYIEYHSGTPGTTTAQYKLSLFDVNMFPGFTFERDVKQLHATTSSADVVPVLTPLRGTITIATTTVTGVGTNFLTALKVGDFISANSTLMRIASVVSDLSATVSASVTGVTGAAYSRVGTTYNEVDGQSLVFPLPQKAIKSVSDIRIEVLHRYSLAPSAGNVTISTATSADSGITAPTAFVSTRPSDYIAVDTVTGNVVNITSVTITGDTQVTLTGFTTGNTHRIWAPVIKTLASEPKAKTVTVGTITFNTSQASGGALPLGKADVFEIDSVLCNGVEIRDQYVLDNGQRPTHYGISQLIRKPEFPAPAANITVRFRYFDHINSGDFFSVGSYTGVRYEDIPSFSYLGKNIRLSDAIDFRPRIGDAGASFASGTTGASRSALPVRDQGIQLDYEYYLPRKDKICIDTSGKFFSVQGVSSLEPMDPPDPDNAMVLYKLELQPYTTSENDMITSYIDNKRYTMRDIGRLEKRIENIEYYTALSLLEQETKQLQIRDGDGFDRFKSGFLVDNFEGHGVGDVTQPDYLCSVDMENNQLRPFFRMDNFNLTVSSTSNMTITGDLATLPYTHDTLVEQPYASRRENVNPYNVFTFIGDLRIHPESDEWFEVDRRPDLIVNEEGNFDAVVRTLEQQGVLGTVWNSWQTQWTGVPVSQGTTTQRLRGEQGWPLRDITTETLAQTIGQARSGVRTSVVARVDNRVVGDRVLSTAAIPFIRSRAIAFVSRGLKPNTRFYPFFEGTDIGPYIIPTLRINVSNASAFDAMTNSTTNADNVARSINGNPQVALNRGDIITAGSNTAIVVHKDTTSLHIVNIRGTITTGQTITGSISGASSTVSAVSGNATLGASLTTTELGDVAGLFIIPNTPSVRFRTGIREFKLTSSSVNNDQYASWARARYSATGTLETRQTTISSVRNADVVAQTLTENRTIVNTFQRVSDTGWYDPLAQTFLVQKEGGAFLTKVDLYFQAKDTVTNLPVRIEIREVVNGYPGRRVLPFSRVVVQAADVNVSQDATAATTFTFPSPVYVQNNVEYALVVLSDSNEYYVWIAQMGQLTVGGDRLISEQPYLGSLFKSQNASTWTAEQTQDLKFKLYRAKFAPLSGQITFANDKLQTRALPSNPLLSLTGNNIVKVFHPNHDVRPGTNVTLSGVAGTTTSNISLTNINRTHTISNVFIDYYTITIGNVATATGFIGGSNVFATQNIGFDAIQPIVQFQNFSETNVDYYVRTTPYSAGAVEAAPGSSVVPNDTNYFSSPKVVLSSENEGASKSFFMTAYLTSTVDNLSPVIDINRTSVVAIKNKVNNPTQNNYNIDLFDTRSIAIANTTIAFSGNVMSTANGTTANIFRSINPGRFITISGAANNLNNATVLVSSVDKNSGNVTVKDFTFVTAAAGAAITLTSKEGFVSEIAPFGGSVISKYITRQVNLKTPARMLKIMFSASIPPVSDIDVYYKILPTGSFRSMSETEFFQASASTPIVKTLDETLFTDIEYNIENLQEFSSFVVKLAFRSTNSSFVPVVRDLRVIACA